VEKKGTTAENVQGKKKTNRRSSACGYATKGTAKRVEEKSSTHLTMEGARAL